MGEQRAIFLKGTAHWVRKRHADEIDYRASTSETLNENGEQFDCILNMEVVEHVGTHIIH